MFAQCLLVFGLLHTSSSCSRHNHPGCQQRPISGPQQFKITWSNHITTAFKLSASLSLANSLSVPNSKAEDLVEFARKSYLLNRVDSFDASIYRPGVQTPDVYYPDW